MPPSTLYIERDTQTECGWNNSRFPRPCREESGPVVRTTLTRFVFSSPNTLPASLPALVSRNNFPFFSERQTRKKRRVSSEPGASKGWLQNASGRPPSLFYRENYLDTTPGSFLCLIAVRRMAKMRRTTRFSRVWFLLNAF